VTLEGGPPAIPDYELLRELGRGTFGSVWLGRSRTGVHHAVKVVPKSGNGAMAREFEGIRAFEVQTRRHPSLVEVRHVGETGDALYCVMELADGYGQAQTFSADDYEPRTLQSDLERKGALTLAEVVPVVRAVLDGLGHLHGRGLLHRDVKPGNIVFVDGGAKLADIGLVASRARREDHAGTPAFMPPETVVDPSGDLYSLGITLYCAVTGAPAARFPELPGTTAPERLAAYRTIAPVLDRACAPHREDRFGDVREFQHALDLALGEVSGPSRRRALAATAIVVVAALAFGAWRALRVEEAVRAQGEPTLSGRLEIRYRDPEPSTVVYAVSETSPVVPLRTLGAVSVHAELGEPAYGLLAYLDERGDAVVLYPSTPDEAREPRTSWATGTFPLEDPGGTLTFVLLASREPVPDYAEVARLVAEVGDPPRCPPNLLLHVGPDGLTRSVTARQEPSRSATPDLGRRIDAGPLPIPIHGSLDRLRAEFGGRFDLVRALAVPQLGSDEK